MLLMPPILPLFLRAYLAKWRAIRVQDNNALTTRGLTNGTELVKAMVKPD